MKNSPNFSHSHFYADFIHQLSLSAPDYLVELKNELLYDVQRES